MATEAISYGADTALTFDISSLGTSSTFVAGYESAEVDNTTDLYLDFIVRCKGIAGHASTAPTVGQIIGLWAWGSNTSLGSTALDVLDGTASAETLSHVSVLNSLKPVGQAAVTVATAGLVYYFQPFSIARLFNGICPPFWGLYLAHNHNGSLAASQASQFTYRGIKRTVA